MENFGFFVIVFWGLLLTLIHYILVKLFFKDYKIINLTNVFENNWAVVTGGTNGIGESFVRNLHKLGYKVLVISRNKEKLNEMLEEYKENIDILCVDFSYLNEETFNLIKEKINSIKISLLINNVGICGDLNYFEDMSVQSIDNILKCNIYSCIYMTKLCLKNMKRNNIKGTILNISSASSKIPFPYLSIYASTKSFIDTFTYNLSIENRYNSINIRNINPYYVSTNMSNKRPSFLCPTSDEYTKSIINNGYFLPHTLILKLIQIINYGFPFYTSGFIDHYFRTKLFKTKYNNKKLS